MHYEYKLSNLDINELTKGEKRKPISTSYIVNVTCSKARPPELSWHGMKEGLDQ